MAKPKLALIPASQGSELISVLPSSGVGDFDFSRSGKATRINSQGLIEEVSNGQSRLNYPMIDGKVVGCPHHILENSATNLVTYSEDFSNSYWALQRVSILSNNEIAPNGTLTATKFTEDTSNNSHQTRPSSVISLNIGQAYTFTCFAKKSERKEFRIENVGQYGVYFDLENGTRVEDSASQIINSEIKELSNGWYKCSVTIKETSRTADYIYLQIAKDGSKSYQGDGSSGIYIYGAMLEQSSYSTSYIPTNGSAVTRSAETANGSGDAATFNDSEGVLMAEINFKNQFGVSRYLGLHGLNASNRVIIGNSANTSDLTCFVISNGSNLFQKTISLSDISTSHKIVLKYKTNDFALWVNGFELEVGSVGDTSNGSLNELSFVGVVPSTQPFYGKTKQVQYFDSTLTDSELEQLTSWTSFTDMAEGQLYTIE